MSEEQLLITLGVKDKGTTTQIKALKNELKYLDSQYKATSNGSKNFEKTTEGLRTKIEYLGKKIEATKTKLDVYKKQMQQAQEGVAKKREEIEKLNQAEGDNSVAINKANKELEKYQQKMIEAQRNINLTETELSNLEKELENTNNALNNQAIVNYQAKMAALSSQLEKTGAALKTLGSTMGALGTKMMALASPILALSAYSAKVGMDFEEGMSKVEAISGATTEEMEKLTEKAKEMGVQTKFSATEASEAFKYMAMAGWDAQQMMDGIEGIMNLAAADGLDLATTSDIVTDAITAFGLKASDAAHFADVLAKASSSANTNVSMLGESFSYVAPVAGSLGFSVEDTSIALGLMANSSVKGSQAGTALRTALINLAKPTEKMQKAMDNCGLSITKSDGSMKSLKEIMDMLRSEMKSMDDDTKLAVLGFDNMENITELASESMEDLSEEEIAQAAALDAGMEYIEGWSEAQLDAALAINYSKKELKKMTLEEKQYAVATEQGTRLTEGLTSAQQASRAAQVFGKEAMAGMLTIINASEEDYNKLTNSIYNCDGAAKEMADTMLDNAKGNITLFKSKLEGLGIQLSAYILPHINSLIEKLSQLVDWFSNLSEETQKNILKMGFYTFGIGAALKVTGSFVSGIGSLLQVGSKLTGFLGNLSTKSATIGRALAKLTTTFGTLGGTIIPVTVAATALGTAIYAGHEYMDAMNNTATKSAEEMSSLEKVFTEMSGVTVYTRKELEKMGLVQEELGDNLSKDFKDSVNKATKNVQEFRFELQKVKIDGVITKEECDGLQSRVNELCSSALETINNRKEEIQNTLGEAFNADGILTQDEKVILEFYNQTFDKNKEEIEKMQGTINELLRKVREEGYVLTDADESMIRNYYAEIQRLELEAQATNNYEIEFEKNKFKERARNLDLEEAETLLKDRRKYYDDEIAERSAYYDTSIQMIESKMGDMNEKQRESAEKDILDLKNAKDKEIDTLQGYYNEEYEALIKQNVNLENELDRYSGKAKETRDKRCEQELNDMLSLYDGINEITESGLIRMYNTNTQTYDNLYVEVDQTTGKIVGCSKYWADESGIHATEVTGANEKVKDSMNSLTSKAQSSFNKMAQDLKDNTKTTIDENNKQIISNGEVVGSYDKITDAGNGLRECITNVNGTPCKVTINKDGAITAVDIVEDKLNQLIKKDRTIDVKVKYTDYYSDGRGNVYYGGKWVSGSGPDRSGYASGTKNATKGVHLVGEEGPELVYFNGGETVLDAEKTKNIITSGGYFNPGTLESNELINNYNNSYSNLSTTNNYNNNIDINSLANAIAGAVANAIKGMSINMDTQKVASIIDKTNGNVGAMQRRLKGC